MFKFITPLNILIVAVILTATYAVWLTYENWSLRSRLAQAAPGHELQASQEQAANLDVVMFYDYSCPYCLSADPTLQNAIEIDGKVKLRYKFVPLINERSEHAARLAFAAGQQDAFVEAHMFLVRNPDIPLDAENIQQIAEELGLDYQQLDADMNSDNATQVLRENVSLMLKMNIERTPTFVMNNVPYVPDVTLDEAKFLELFEKARNSEPLN